MEHWYLWCVPRFDATCKISKDFKIFWPYRSFIYLCQQAQIGDIFWNMPCKVYGFELIHFNHLARKHLPAEYKTKIESTKDVQKTSRTSYVRSTYVNKIQAVINVLNLFKVNGKDTRMMSFAQQTFTFSKSSIEILEKGVI